MPEFTASTQPSAAEPETEDVRGGLAMARALRAAGVETFFTVCGGHILDTLDAAGELGMRVIDTRHEGAAALAAEGWALATGQTGFATVTAGPGFTNALTGFVDAAAWSVPLVLWAGRTGLQHANRGAVMDIDQRAMVAQLAKWTATCYQTPRIGEYVAEAFYRARSGRPGPVYLEVPQNVLMASAPARQGPGGFPSQPPLPAPAPADLERALDALQKAERPLMLVGSGAFWSGAGPAVQAFAERAEIPIITTSAARGIVPDSHPWCLGSLLHGGFALYQADVALVLGTAFNANVGYGAPPLFQPEQTVIQVDISPDAIGGNRRADVALISDVRRAIEDLTAAWGGAAPKRASWLEQGRAVVDASMEQWDGQIASHAGSQVHAGAAVREMVRFAREAAGDRLTLVADGGDALAWALGYCDAQLPGRLLTTTTALGTLGVGVPFALAAQAARPDEPVFLFCGDGSFGLTAMEIDTAVRHKLPVVAVVSNNAAWGDVRHEQDIGFGGRHVASDLAYSRYDLMAAAFGGHGEHVTRLDQVRPALERSLDSGLPSVVNVETDPEVLSDLLRWVGQMNLM